MGAGRITRRAAGVGAWRCPGHLRKCRCRHSKDEKCASDAQLGQKGQDHHFAAPRAATDSNGATQIILPIWGKCMPLAKSLERHDSINRRKGGLDVNAAVGPNLQGMAKAGIALALGL
jgi:hypothetical protein